MYPTWIQDLTPKETMGIHSFQETFGESSDGRGVVCMVFDTGIDPGAPGLQKTSDGKPKILALLDATGSGDVNMSTVRSGFVEPPEEPILLNTFSTSEDHPSSNEDGSSSSPSSSSSIRYVLGATGRYLPVDLPAWGLANPSSEWRVGAKSAYALLPRPLVEQVRARRRAHFDQHQAECQAQYTAPPHVGAAASALLKALQDGFHQDCGPTLDFLSFHDGSHWRAAVYCEPFYPDFRAAAAPRARMPLPPAPPVPEYAATREFRSLDGGALQLNYAVNVYDGGRTLEFVTDAGSHGTHVAAIIARCDPQHPQLDGVAPGAQLISVKIGDSRLGSMETGTALARALSAATRLRPDLINVSYGEFTSGPNQGRVVDLINVAVRQHGVVFVSSAGNNGPALTTVGAPGGTTTAAISVGAFVDPALVQSGYSLLSPSSTPNDATPPDSSAPQSSIAPPPPPPQVYQWSSVGPAADGHGGVTLVAPGAAYTSVPNWTQSRSALMHGTSMSSPWACGAVARILGALKARSVPYTPDGVKLALQNTARRLALEPLRQGAGLIQPRAALEFLLQWSGRLPQGVFFDVSVARSGHRGIYLRNPQDLGESDVVERAISVRPQFHEWVEARAKLQFEVPFAISSTQPWIHVPEKLILSNELRTFPVRIVLPAAAGLHCGEILAHDARFPEIGPLFRVPVTVVQPVAPAAGASGSWSSPPLQFDEVSQIERFFLTPPKGSTWVHYTVSCTQAVERRHYAFAALQLVDGANPAGSHLNEMISFEQTLEKSFKMDIADDATLEIVLARNWNDASPEQVPTIIQISARFFGLKPSHQDTLFLGVDGGTAVSVSQSLPTEPLAPQLKLHTWQSTLRPNHAVILAPDVDRDILQVHRGPRQCYRMRLTYAMELSEAAEVVVRLPNFSDLLYESPHEAQFISIYDESDSLVGVHDYHPQKLKLGAGKYTVRVLFRHENIEQLKKMQNQVLSLERTLASPISVSLYTSLPNLLAEKPFTSATLSPGQSLRLYSGRLVDSALPKGSVFGDLLTGTITYGTSRWGEDIKPRGYSVVYPVPPLPNTKPIAFETPQSSTESSSETPQSSSESSSVPVVSSALEEAIPTYFCDLSDQLLTQKRYTELDFLLKLVNPPDFPVLKRLNLALQLAKLSGNPTAILDSAQALIADIDQIALAASFGKKNSTGNTTHKGYLVDAYLSWLFSHQTPQSSEWLASYNLLANWVDVAEITDDMDRALHVHLEYLRHHRPVELYRLEIITFLSKFLNPASVSKLQPAQISKVHKLFCSTLTDLGWHHWSNHYQSWFIHRYSNYSHPIDQ